MVKSYKTALALLVPAPAGTILNRVASELRCALVELDHQLINWSESNLPFEVVSGRLESVAFAFSTNLRRRPTMDHPRPQWHYGQHLVPPADEPQAAPFQQGDSHQNSHIIPSRPARDVADLARSRHPRERSK
jgi:hypothetical protein